MWIFPQTLTRNKVSYLMLLRFVLLLFFIMIMMFYEGSVMTGKCKFCTSAHVINAPKTGTFIASQ